MPAKKKDMNALVPIPEDTFQRVKKIMTLPAMRAAKGENTAEELCIPPAMHSLPEFKTAIHYWQQCAIVKYVDKDMKTPSREKHCDNELLAKKGPSTHTRKEITDLFKQLKKFEKQCKKRTDAFKKQLVKRETKDGKRSAKVTSREEMDSLRHEELRSARNFARDRDLFGKYMLESKLGNTGPRKNALLIMEVSDKQKEWADEAKDEAMKLLDRVFSDAENPCETLNICVFSCSTCVTWCPNYTPYKTDPKKNLADAQKWLGKNFSVKMCQDKPWPPDWLAMLKKVAAEGQAPPFQIYLCCSRSPENSPDVLDYMQELRGKTPPPNKGDQSLPINCVAFDHTIQGEEEEENFFKEIVGTAGSFFIDTSADDLCALDKTLKAVQVKEKAVAKFDKNLVKLPDVSAEVKEDRELFRTQVALWQMVQNDLAILDWACKNDAPMPGPEI